MASTSSTPSRMSSLLVRPRAAARLSSRSVSSGDSRKFISGVEAMCKTIPQVTGACGGCPRKRCELEGFSELRTSVSSGQKLAQNLGREISKEMRCAMPTPISKKPAGPTTCGFSLGTRVVGECSRPARKKCAKHENGVPKQVGFICPQIGRAHV